MKKQWAAPLEGSQSLTNLIHRSGLGTYQESADIFGQPTTGLCRWAGLVWFGLMVLLAGCTQQAEAPQKTQSIAQGRKLYTQLGCPSCHGPEGRGDGKVASTLNPPPRDFSDQAAYRQGASPEAISESIRKGVPGSGMPPYAFLSEGDRGKIADFIHAMQKETQTKD